MITVSTNLSDMRKKIQYMRKSIMDEFEAGIGALMYQALTDVTSKTPVDTGKLRDGWYLKRIGGNEKSRVQYRPVLYVIWNKTTHGPDGEPLKKALLDGKDYTLLEVMEYGSSAHVIVPKNKKFLTFKIDGRIIRTDRVDHPGTKPYAMMRLANDKLNARIARYVIDFQKHLIDGIWEK